MLLIATDNLLKVFLPLAMHNPSLLTSLIAWSSSHLSLRDPSFQQVAIRNRCTALRDLRNALDCEPTNTEITLAMSLVLCSLESIMADNGHAWYLHLEGAARIIASKFNNWNHWKTQNIVRNVCCCSSMMPIRAAGCSATLHIAIL